MQLNLVRIWWDHRMVTLVVLDLMLLMKTALSHVIMAISCTAQYFNSAFLITRGEVNQ